MEAPPLKIGITPLNFVDPKLHIDTPGRLRPCLRRMDRIEKPVERYCSFYQ